ncbi:MAG: hypothetical protein JXA71_02380 [Chitinispirillaceae bacterium]|nr:hypothetical protein [Chitinispirillaceae bacterium]
MKQVLVLFCLTGIATLFAGCGFPYRTLSSHSFGQTGALNEQCAGKKLASEERATADSLFALGRSAFEQGKHRDALDHIDRARIYYRLALLKDELRMTREKYALVQADLMKAEDRLATYKKVLEKLTTGGGGE